MRAVDLKQVLDACTSCATEIRAAAMQHGSDLDDADRHWLFALATIVDRKVVGMAAARGIVERTVVEMIDLLDALDAPTYDLEPVLGAPERHPTPSWGFGVRYDPATDQRFWAAGGDTDETEIEDEHGTDLDRGELDTADNEPSLGAPENHDAFPDQTRWAQGCRNDREGPWEGTR